MLTVKRWFIHRLDETTHKWKKVFRMCLTRAEALYNMELLEQSDKLCGIIDTYRIVCISIKPSSVKQMELNL